MDYLFGFIFKLFKIAIQAYLYASAVRWLVKLTAARYANSTLLRLSTTGQRLWQRSFVVVYVALFLFSCTYWGDRGLGSARLPLGYGEAMEEIDTESYFDATTPFNPTTNGAVWVNSFQVTNEVLCAQTSTEIYFTYNLATKEHRVFGDAQEYNAYAAPRGLPASGELESFWKQYSCYWGGWRFWLLA